MPKAIARHAPSLRTDLGPGAGDSAETKRRDDDREHAREHRRHDGSEMRRDAAGEREGVERAEHSELERHRLSDAHVWSVAY